MHKRLLTILLIIVFSILEIVPTNAQKGKVLKIKLSDLKDKIAAAWIGEMVGNMYGLPHENKYILSPGLEKWPYGYSKSLDKLKKV